MIEIKSQRLLEVGEPALIKDSTVTSDAVQARLIRKCPAFSKLSQMGALLITITRQQGKSYRFYVCLIEIKSRRLLKVGEPALIKDSTVTSDAVQARLIRKCPAFSKLGRMGAYL